MFRISLNCFYFRPHKNVILYFRPHRWHQSEKSEFPQTFDEVRKTIENYRKNKYGKSPTTPKEIAEAFEKEVIMTNLGKSLHFERDDFFNGIIIEENFCNCIFSSSKSIELIKNIPEKDRFFLMDGTFRITPHGTFEQVLILHAQYGTKV